MYKLHIQEHPFKSDLTIHEIVSGTSLQQAYESLDLPLPIENARFVIEDEQVTDYSIIPPDESVVCAKLVPSGEDTMPLLGALQMVAGVILLAVPGARWLGAGLILSGIGTICAYDYISKMSFGDQESQSMRGGSGGTNTWNPVPVIFGEHLLAPDLAALDYTTLTESKDDSKADIYDLHQLYVLGQKPLIVDKISIGDSLLFERKQVTCEGVLTVLSETRARLLHNTASIAAMVTAEMVTVAGKVTFEGFSRPQNNKEFTVVASTSSYIEFSTNNDVVAETANIKVGTLVDSGVYAGVKAEIVTDGDFTTTPYDQIVNETTVNLEIKYGASVPTVFTTPGGVKSVDFRLSVPQGLYGLSGAKKEKTSVSVSMYVKLIAQDESMPVKPITQDEWEYVDTYRFTDYKTPQNRDKEWSYEFRHRGQWMLMFKKETKDLSSDDGVNTVYLSTVISHKVDAQGNPYPPVSDLVKDDFTFLALKIQATDQLNGNITNLNCVLRQGNRVYDAASTAVNEYEKWVPGYSNNPASVYIDLLTNPIINRYPIGTAGWDSPETLPIDWTAMKDWYLFCEGIGYTCNGIVNSTSTVREELEKIANTGRATSILRDGLYGVSIDRVKMPVQLFTPRNTRDFSAQRTYNEPFDGVRIKFTDKNIGYQASEAVVFPQGSDQKKFDEVSVPYITDTTNAKRYGGYYYNTKSVRQESFIFSTDFEYLVCTAGDRIKFQHDVPLVGIAASRISSLQLSGGSIIGIVIDEYVTLEAGKDYSVLIRAKDSTGAFVLREPLKVVAAPDTPTRALTFVTQQGDTSLFAQGDVLAFGEYGQVTEDLVITDISCGDDITATITAVKYDESIYELASFPTWAPIVTDAGTSGRITAIPTTSLRSMERMQINMARNIGSTMYNEAQPTTPYREGDGWRRGINMYICTQTRSSSELFTASDWQLVTSDIFQSIAKDIFGEAFPEHRWFIHPDGDYPLLFSDLFIVNSGDTTKKYILENDENYWDAGQSTGKLLVPSVIGANDYTISNIKAKVGLAHTAYISGRYGRNGWMGESYTNIYPTATNEITLTAGTYVLQCYTGSIECSYGTALSSVPLVFTATAGTVTFTPVGVTYASLTKTDFVPPYYVGSAPVSSYTSAISSPTVTGVVDVYNRPERLLIFAELYADAQNCIALALFGENIRVIVTGQGVSSVNDIPISELVIADNTLPFSIAYESTTQFVEVILNGFEYTFNDSGVYGLFGSFDELANVKYIKGYTSGTTTYVYGDSIQLDLVPDTLYLGKDHSSTYYFNNQVHEVTYS